MSSTINQAAFAVTSDGTHLMNVAHVDRRLSPSQLLQWALGQPGNIFIGVQMSPAEVQKVLTWIRDVHDEAVAFVVGPRVRRSRATKRAMRKARH
jgi:hypothetical protein